MKPNLAEAPDPKYPMTYGKFGSSKLDGLRALSQYSTLVTRSLKLIPNEAVRERFGAVQGLDGELIWGEPTDPQVFHKTSSAVRTEKGSIDNIKMYVFDILDKTEVYQVRLQRLMAMELPDWYVKVPQKLLHSDLELEVYYAEQLALGYEGVILRSPQALYKEGRSTAKSQDMLKVKPFLDSEAIVLDVFEAMENQNEQYVNEVGRTVRSSHAENKVGNGMAGGFTVQKGTKVFNIAAGFLNHQQRIEVFTNKHNYIGKIATFRHLPIGEKDVPRHGRFLRWRDKFDIGV